MLIFISFCICCGPRFGPGQLKAAKARSDPDTYPFFTLTPPPFLLPTNSLGKQESLDWIAVKKGVATRVTASHDSLAFASLI